MDRPVYITGVGKYLPGDPVSNDEVEERLGRIGGRPSRAKRRILESNGIQTRHYALDPERRPTHRNWELAARAAQDEPLARTLQPGERLPWPAAGSNTCWLVPLPPVGQPARTAPAATMA